MKRHEYSRETDYRLIYSHGVFLRSSIDIDARLLRRAMRLSGGSRTKKATVEAAQRLLARTDAQENTPQPRGKVRWHDVTGKGMTSSRAGKRR